MNPPIQVRHEGIKVKLAWVIAAAVLAGLARATWWLLRRPAVLFGLGVAAGTGWAWFAYGSHPVAWATAGLVALLLLWACAGWGSFRRVFVWPVRACWRRLLVYRPQWAALMRMLELGLGEEKDGNEQLPALASVRCQASVDRVLVRTLPGQVLADYAQHADRFTACFEAVDCRVRSVARTTLGDVFRGLARRVPGLRARLTAAPTSRVQKRLVEFWLLRRDPLQDPTGLLPVPSADTLDLDRLPVAVSETGRAWQLRLLATHTLLVGATGAGKGSVLWSIVRALGNAIRTRLVELWVIDPKGGMEFARGQRLFSRYCFGEQQPTDPDGKPDTEKKRGYEHAFADLLETAVDTMRERQARLRGVLRTHKPTPGDPLIVILIDEIASLTAYVTDRDAKKRISAALQLLLSQGRAAGVVLIAAGQDARKEVLPDRGLFPNRLALRLNEPDEVDLVLGNRARDRGARADEIGLDAPGITYVLSDETPEPERIRFAHITDNEIDTTCALYEPGAPEPHDTTNPANEPDHAPGPRLTVISEHDDRMDSAA